MPDRRDAGDIEDVLSSIRRLVSEETRAAVEPPVEAGDKLVLTPDFRVGKQQGDAAPRPLGDETVSGRLAVFKAAVSQQIDGSAAEDSDSAPQEGGPGMLLQATVAAPSGPSEAPEAPMQDDLATELGEPEPLRAEPAAPAQDAVATEPDLVEDEELDEEALRDLIRDMIREELQGELGARITRNVRKLVRTEINRALASRDLG